MKGYWDATTAHTVDLGCDQLLTLRACRGTRVRVLCGSMWLTEEGRAQDVFAASGAEVELAGAGAVVVEGMGLARVQVIRPARWVALSRIWAVLRRAAVRLRHPGRRAPLAPTTRPAADACCP